MMRRTLAVMFASLIAFGVALPARADVAAFTRPMLEDLIRNARHRSDARLTRALRAVLAEKERGTPSESVMARVRSELGERAVHGITEETVAANLCPTLRPGMTTYEQLHCERRHPLPPRFHVVPSATAAH